MLYLILYNDNSMDFSQQNLYLCDIYRCRPKSSVNLLGLYLK